MPKMSTLKFSMLLVFTFMLSLTLQAQKKDFTSEQLLNNKMPQIVNPLPRVVSWTANENPIIARGNKSFVFDIKSKKENPYTEKNTSNLDGKRVVIRDNDLFLVNGKQEVRLTNDKDKEINPTFSPDSNYVGYTKNNNLYAVNVATQAETQFTFDGSETILNGYASWVYFEEILGRPSRYRSFWWSPDSKSIAFFRADDSEVPVFTLTNADGQHGEVESLRYPKSGDKNPEIKIGIVNVGSKKITWADFNEKDDQYFGMPVWKKGSGNSLLTLWINRGQDDFKVYETDINTGTKKIFYEEKQKTWVDLNDLDRFNFLDNGNILMLSDKSGWRHIYLHDNKGKLINPVTDGKYTVTGITHVDEKNNTVYFTARGKENTARVDLYSVKTDGKNLKRLSFGDYNHRVQMSPSGKYFVTNYSNTQTPSRLALVDNTGKKIADIGDSKGAEMDNYNIAKTELIRVKSEHGLYELPAVVTWPLNMDPA